MTESTVVEIRPTTQISGDALTEVIRGGARQLLADAVEAEVASFMAAFQEEILGSKKRLVRNGYLPEREIMTGIGGIAVRIPRVRDRGVSGQEDRLAFRSKIVPSYLRKAKSVEKLIPWLYLRGVSTDGFSDALEALLGPAAPGLSASTVSRLKSTWESEHEQWQARSLAGKRYVYVWADGVYCNARMEDAKLCMLVLIGATEDGTKELIAVDDGYRESEQSWLELLRGLKARGLEIDPKLAVGDGSLGFWKALAKVFGNTRQQRCWVHKTANVLNKMPKAIQPKAKQALHEIWMADTRANAETAFDLFLETYEAKYPKATNCLAKDRRELLAFYDFPAEQWPHLRTTNPIESTFATVKLRTAKTRNCLSRRSMISMVFKLCQSAEKNWRRLRGYKLIADVIKDIRFIDGVREDRIAA
ncbi:MAG: IS256 family transposase [Thermoanaerobaculia bacterium]|nr:IS256 family transposase [Thermoanaerobaculia bacterium]